MAVIKRAFTKQKWRDLFFLHWECDPEIVQKTLPKGLIVETFNGKAYLGLIPFAMKEVIFDGHLPLASDFLEMNIRTYVFHEKKGPGIWFYSLDTNSKWMATFAKITYFLPYFFSNMSCIQNETQFDFVASRDDKSLFTKLELTFPFNPAPVNSLEYFLIERYTLYTSRFNSLFFATVEHQPYPISQSKVHSFKIENFLPFQVNSSKPVHSVYSPGVDVKVSILNKLT